MERALSQDDDDLVRTFVVAVGVVIGCAAAARAPAPSAAPLSAFVTPPTPSSTHGAIYGVVTNLARGEPLSGVSVTVTSPSLGGIAQSAFTDDHGGFAIDELPAGEYVVTFFYLNITRIKRASVRLHEVTRVVGIVDESKAQSELIEVERTATHCYGEWPDWRMNRLEQPTITCSMDCRQATGVCADRCWSRGR